MWQAAGLIGGAVQPVERALRRVRPLAEQVVAMMPVAEPVADVPHKRLAVVNRPEAGRVVEKPRVHRISSRTCGTLTG